MSHFGRIDQSISALREEIQSLDVVDDVFGLSEEEVCRRNEATVALLRQLCNRKSLLAQRATINWLKDGDVNSKLFHKAIALRRRKNGLIGMDED